MLKKIAYKYFESLVYFYRHLGYKVFIVFGFSIVIGVLDSLGLTMFLPLLQMVNDSSAISAEELGRLSFLLDIFESARIDLTLLSVLLIMSSFFLVKGLVYYLAGIYRVNVQEGFIDRLRTTNLKGLNSITYKYFIGSDVGRIQNTLTGEVDRVANAFKFYFRALQNVIMIMIYMVFAFLIDAQFAILVTIGGVIANFLYKRFYDQTKKSSRILTGEANTFQSLVIQNVANYKYLKATGSLSVYQQKLLGYIEKIKDSNKRIGKLDASLTAGREPLLVLIVVSIIYIQTSLLGSGLGPILISLIFFYRALNYLLQMQMDWNRFLAVSGSVENITSFEKEMRKNKEDIGAHEVTEPIESLSLRNISFEYGNTVVLKNIDLEISKCQTIGFVGESGSGKTTLINIIAGLLTVNSGQYLINGINSDNLNLETFQKKIGYITQDSIIFNDSLFNNITFWAEKTEENLQKFWEVITKTALLNFVNSLPEKENEVLEHNGINLSGGQKQRISIARELFKEVDILLLDEATSALDSETESIIQRNMEDLKGDYIILVVAHRIATIKNADKILVVEKGKIIKSGNYEDLIKKSEYFKNLVRLQQL
ncbi:ABC transporter ATP-binding protein [Christiangramia portivictoriae]|uniref:ABC transporter ATP-binding protein n=1 Tax=Christiangramia portivictoriae TaxID=326069 RepID=UPI0003F7F8CD|nr:ABC transporter ATP-binding protein [Christiangramia portivictoriae]